MSLRLAILLTLHQLAAVVWVGGMVFAHFFLRPVLKESLEPPSRIQLALGVFRRFFPVVWVCIATLWITGTWVAVGHYGGQVAWDVLVMAGIALVMTLVFAYISASPYRKMHLAVEEENWRRASAKFSRIRKLVALNLVLGLTTIVVVGVGRPMATAIASWLGG